jgi:tetratricopeptide (TPR) repeat protein
MSESTKAVFLSYASQDSEAAQRICDALRTAGLEVWFDQNELVGGDAWDQKIRKQIKECALFVPIISPNTNARAEGYFRLEWKLAVDRSHLMADDQPFLFPIVIGDVTDATARVPDKFREVQWTRLRLDETPAELAERVTKLLSGDVAGVADTGPGSTSPATGRRKKPERPAWLRHAWSVVILVLFAYYGLRPLWRKTHSEEAPTKPVAEAAPEAPVSAARQLTYRARDMSVEQYSSTAADFATAEGLIQKALEMDPNDAEIWAIASLFHTSVRTRGFDHAAGRREQARSAAERATRLAPDSVNALFALGRAQRDSDRTAAEATFRRLLEIDPNHADALSQVAWICDQTDRFDEALALYDRVLALNPRDAALTRYVRYLLFFHYGRFAEAEAEVRESVSLQPSANSVAGQAMVALTWRGDAEAAARALAAAPAELQSQPRMIWVGALTHLARHDPAEVLRTLARTEADYIQDNWFAGPKALLAGLAHRQADRPEAARVAWESALALVDARLKTTPDSGALRLSRGQLLAWLGRGDEARREARTLQEMSRSPAAAEWLFSPALIQAALGDADAVLPQLEKFLANEPGKNVGWPLTPALVRIDVRWDAIRGDPRFQKLLEQNPLAEHPK